MRTFLLRSVPVSVLMFALPVAAQTLDGSSIKPNLPSVPPSEKAKLPPPAAVPGARARADSVTTTDRGTNDLPPTEALFDAINRGDINSAKDAIGRGADLDGTNLLGLTPLELSVDLARNDISFLLLSMRGGASNRNASAGPAEPATLTPAQRRAAERQAAAQAKAEALAQRRMAAATPTREAAPAARQGPTLFAGDGGTPVPAAGFLGFGNQR